MKSSLSDDFITVKPPNQAAFVLTDGLETVKLAAKDNLLHSH